MGDTDLIRPIALAVSAAAALGAMLLSNFYQTFAISPQPAIKAAIMRETMKSNFLGAVTLSIVVFASMVSAASALDRRVNINNQTQSVMTEFYASNSGTQDWQEDILGKDVVASGDTVTINIDDGSGFCKFDFRAIFDDGAEVISSDNNVCELSDFNITE